MRPLRIPDNRGQCRGCADPSEGDDSDPDNGARGRCLIECADTGGAGTAKAVGGREVADCRAGK